MIDRLSTEMKSMDLGGYRQTRPELRRPGRRQDSTNLQEYSSESAFTQKEEEKQLSHYPLFHSHPVCSQFTDTLLPYSAILICLSPSCTHTHTHTETHRQWMETPGTGKREAWNPGHALMPTLKCTRTFDLQPEPLFTSSQQFYCLSRSLTHEGWHMKSVCRHALGVFLGTGWLRPETLLRSSGRMDTLLFVKK